VRAHPARTPHEQPCRVDLGLHVGELERDALVLDDRAAELHTLLRVLERVLVRGPRDSDGLGADERTARFEGAHRRLHTRALALTRLGEPRVELLLAAEQAAPRHAHVFENDLGGVTGADAVLLELLALTQTPRARRDHEACVAAGLQLR